MALNLSYRSSQIIQSEIRNMSIECERVNGINLSQGICDLELPLPVKLGATEAISGGINHYTRYDGLSELREAISRKLMRDNGIHADPEKNIVVSGGSTGAFYCACLALLNPGDEVILFEPYYGYHVNTLLAVDAVPVYASLEPPTWSIDFDALEGLISPRTKGMMINTPANPSGKVFGKEELNQLAEFALRHELFVFTDEIYEYFVYDNNVHISPGALESIADQTITISGYSKTFSITGWRIGYAVCHEKWAQMIGYVNDLIYVCGPAPLQMGVARGIDELPDTYYQSLCQQYSNKRDKICGTLAKIGLEPYVPQGAYYVLSNVKNLPGSSSKEKAMFLLNQTGVATVPGEAFYADGTGENLVRFCFAKDDDIVDEACQRLLQLRL
ncbi:MAG TPA: pyridoxal phosphate-dependent aminotransferase [Anaerolineales bacterium]|nr:pyridoxal phosphate-dependent aminotransferase [Anaerolineales bacterium]